MNHRIHMVLAFASIVAALPGQSAEVARLEKEAAVLRVQVKIAEANAEVARLQKELNDLKKGKLSPKKKTEIEIRPRWQPPNMRPGEITVAKDADDVWWYYERRVGTGQVMTYEFATQREAHDYVSSVTGSRPDLRFVSLDDLRKRPKPRK